MFLVSLPGILKAHLKPNMAYGSMPRKSVTNILLGGTNKYYELLILLTKMVDLLINIEIIR